MTLFDRYRGQSDEEWFETLASTVPGSGRRLSPFARLFRQRRQDLEIPTLPTPELQEAFIGSSGRQALSEAWVFYRRVHSVCAELGRPIGPETRILDFGCGWGRMIRFFMKDTPALNLCGVDVDPAVISICRSSMPSIRFDVIDPRPPLEVRDRSFDLVFAYSVFSHLSEDVHLAWVRELSRVLDDGGLLLATTQKRSFMEFCNSLRPEPAQSLWHKSLVQAFRPCDEYLARYDRGEFLWSATGGGGVRDNSFYGEAVIPRAYVAARWAPMLTLSMFDQESLPQALIVAERSAASS